MAEGVGVRMLWSVIVFRWRVGFSPYLRVELIQIVRIIFCHLPYSGVGD